MIIGSLKALKGLFSLEVGPCFKGIYKGVCVRVPGSIKGSIRVQGLSSFGSFTGSLSCGFILWVCFVFGIGSRSFWYSDAAGVGLANSGMQNTDATTSVPDV